MRNQLFIVLFITFLVSCQSYPTYEEYLRDFNKTYATEGQKQYRRQIYQERIAKFTQITDYVPGVNNFTDWTAEEIARLKSRNSGNSPNVLPIPAEPSKDEQYISVGVPTALDWRTSKAVTSVKNQGDCGSCWAFGVAAYVESKLIIERGYNQSIDLSEQYLVSCTPNADCKGGWPQDAMKVVAKGGIPYESSFPYDPFGQVSPSICTTKNKNTDAGNKYRLEQNVTDSRIITLLQKGPLTISISADNWEYYSSGIFSCSSTAKLSHVVLLVGYTADYWIVKNQWGKLWGQSGYMKVTRDRSTTSKNCMIGADVVYMDPNPLQVAFQRRLYSLFLAALIIFVSLMF